MAFIQYLRFNGEALPLPTNYDCELSAVEADTSGETEAGTTQRDVIRQGVVSISVEFAVSSVWLKKLTVYSKQDKLAVQYFDTETLETKETEMYVDGYKAKLQKDTSYKGLWTVSFTLHEF
jgi:N-acetylmuramoyl-L-alanine amidase CwlA